MFFSIGVILAIGLVAYFHYVQGFFSGILSALCAAIASMLAMSYYEPLSDKFNGKMTDNAHGLVLMALFIVLYLVLRTTFDSLVPGQVRLPAIVDKVGGAICGIVAALFGIGTLVIAAQTMPFGPSIGGYARYELSDAREVQLPTRGQAEDSATHDEIKSEKWPLDDQQTMYVAADDFVVGAIKSMSDGGALEGSRTFVSIHPALLDETFFQRLGMQVGAKHVAFNSEKSRQVELVGTYAIAGASQISAEIKQIRPREIKPSVLKSDPTHQMVVVRLNFTSAATDSDQAVRISPGNVRLVARDKDYYPVGTLENGVLATNRIDDFLFLTPGTPADFVFYLPVGPAGGASAIDRKGDGATAPMSFAPGAFLEVKRMVRMELSGQLLATTMPGDAKGVIRKSGLTFEPQPGDPTPKMTAPANAAPPTANPAAANPAAASPAAATPPADAGAGAAAFQFAAIKVSPGLGFTINVGQHDGDSAEVKFNSGSATLADKKIAKLNVRPTDTLDDLKKGDYPAGDFVVPDGTKLVQVSGAVGGNASDAWEWATNLGSFELVDAAGTKYTPNGAWAKVTKAQAERMVGAYDSGNAVTTIAKDEGIPTDVTILFLVPDNTQLKALNYKGNKISDAVLNVE